MLLLLQLLCFYVHTFFKIEETVSNKDKINNISHIEKNKIKI